MTEENEEKSGKKRSIYATIVAVTVVCAMLLISSSLFYCPGDESDSSNELDPHGTAPTVQYLNFTMGNLTIVSASVNGQYQQYSIIKPTFTNETANATLKKYFGTIDSTLTFENRDDDAIFYTGSNESYFITNEGKVVWIVNSYTRYPIEEIGKNSSLYDVNQSRNLVEKFINKTIGTEFNGFKYSKVKTPYGISRSGTFVKDYTFYYERMVDNISSFDYAAGKIIVSISPNGTIMGFNYELPVLKASRTTAITNITSALSDVDRNFQTYSKHLFAGYQKYTLFNAESVYGKVDGNLTIGWRLDFYCNDDKTKVTSTFVH